MKMYTKLIKLFNDLYLNLGNLNKNNLYYFLIEFYLIILIMIIKVFLKVIICPQ